MQPLGLVFSFDHLTSALFGPSTSWNAPSLADPPCRRFSAPDHTQTLLPLPLLPFPKSSGSTSTPLFPKSSSSTEGSQFSTPEDKKRFWGTIAVVSTAVVVCADYFYVPFWLPKSFIGYVTQETWKDWYWTRQRRRHESARESAIYDKLKKGPVFEETIEHTIPRTALVEEIRQVITPAGASRLYPVIIGEHGTRKTSLIKLAVDGMDEPKAVIYIDLDIDDDSQFDIAEVMRMALGWSPDQVIDSSKRNYSNSFR
jgi:hypothetical protein